MVLRVSLIVGVQYEFGACISTQLVGDYVGTDEFPSILHICVCFDKIAFIKVEFNEVFAYTNFCFNTAMVEFLSLNFELYSPI